MEYPFADLSSFHKLYQDENLWRLDFYCWNGWYRNCSLVLQIPRRDTFILLNKCSIRERTSKRRNRWHHDHDAVTDQELGRTRVLSTISHERKPISFHKRKPMPRLRITCRDRKDPANRYVDLVAEMLDRGKNLQTVEWMIKRERLRWTQSQDICDAELGKIRKDVERRRVNDPRPRVTLIGYEGAGVSSITDLLKEDIPGMSKSPKISFEETAEITPGLPRDSITLLQKIFIELEDTYVFVYILDASLGNIDNQITYLDNLLVNSPHVPKVIAINEMEDATDEIWDEIERKNYLMVEASTLEGIPELRELIVHNLKANVVSFFPWKEYGDLIEVFDGGVVESNDPGQNGSWVKAYVPDHLLKHFKRKQVRGGYTMG